VQEHKRLIPMDKLFSGMPEEYSQFLKYVRALSFKEEPDYKTYIKLFEQCMLRMGIDPREIEMDWK